MALPAQRRKIIPAVNVCIECSRPEVSLFHIVRAGTLPDKVYESDNNTFYMCSDHSQLFKDKGLVFISHYKNFQSIYKKLEALARTDWRAEKYLAVINLLLNEKS